MIKSRRFVPQIGHIAFRVNHVDCVVDKWQQLGISFEHGYPQNAGISGKIAVLKGPDGERIELLDRPDLRDM